MKLLISVSRKLVQILFILWVGGIAPLTYFNIFALDHFVTPYRFALLEQLPGPRTQLSVALAPAQVERLNHKLLGQREALNSRTIYASWSQFFESTQSLYWLSSSAQQPRLFYYSRLNRLAFLYAYSVDLPPPDQPPRLLRFSI